MKLDKKTSVNISEKSTERNRPLNAHKVYHIVLNSRMCPFDSQMFNSEPVNVLSYEHFG